MKKNLILTACALLLWCTFSFTQTFYYSGGKKIPLVRDSLRVFVAVKYWEGRSQILDRLSGQSEVRQVRQSPHKNIMEVYLQNRQPSSALLSRIKKDNSIAYAWEAYSLDGIPFIPTGEILLKPKQAVALEDVIQKLRLTGKIERTNARPFDFMVIKVIDPGTLFSIANSIYESGLVEWCHPNFYVPVTLSTNDPYFADQNYLKNTGQFSGTAGIDINVEGAWSLTKGTNVRVAVVDDGVEAHEDLGNRVLEGNTPLNALGLGAPGATSAHGECVAGIIGATQDNGIGITGVAPESLIVPVNIFTGLETALDLANGINWAWNQGQAGVLNNSWGYNTTSQTQAGFDAIIQAIANARTLGRGGKGTPVVFASGNFNSTINDVSFPANVNGVITVGACSKAGVIYDYSQRGASMDLVAPSGAGNLLDFVVTTDRMGLNGYSNDNYNPQFGGTSAACPQVAGVVALMIAANPALTEAQITSILQSTATDMGASGFDNTYGYGRVNACAAVRQAIAAATITGAGSFCNGTSQYSVGGVTPAAITWTSSSTSIATVTQGNPATLNMVTNGVITLTATVATACGNVVLTKQVILGTPNAPAIRPYIYDHSCGTYLEAYCTEPAGATGYRWNYNFGQVIQDQIGAYTNYIYITPMRNGITAGLSYYNYLTVQAKNGCGYSVSSTQLSLTFGPVPATCSGGGGGGIHLRVSPNPVRSVLTVETTDQSSFTQLKIIDKMGRITKIYKYVATKKATLNIADLPVDTYRIQVLVNNEWKTVSFMKQ